MDEVYKKNGTPQETIDWIENIPKKSVRNMARFEEIVKFKNPPDYKADFTSNKLKWGPVFTGVGSGFRFLGSDCTITYSYPYLGSLTSFASEKLSDEAANKFLPIFRDMIHPEEE